MITNFMTVIASMILSAITATIITMFINITFSKRIDKQTEDFIEKVKKITLDAIEKFNNK